MSTKIARALSITAMTAIALAAVAELLSPLMVTTLGYDGYHAKMWIDAFPAVMRDGVWYPHWLPNGYGGLGAATFYFYPPLAFFILTPFRLLFTNADSTTIYHLVGFVMTAGSFAAMWYLLRRNEARVKLAVFGALLYAFAPYHFLVLYTRSGLSEHLAFVWAPLVFAGIFEIIRRNRSRGFAITSISWGLLMLSHVPAAVTVGVGAIAVCVVNLRGRGWRPVSVVILAMVLGTGCAAFYLLPVEHFAPFSQLKFLQVTHAGLEDPTVALLDVIHGNNFTVKVIALVHYAVLFVMTAVLIYLWRKRKTSDWLLFSLAAICFADLFFQTAGISRPVWNALHFTQIVQFAWRWNMLAIVVGAMVYARLVDERTRPWIDGSITLLAFTALFFAVTTNLDLRVHPRDVKRPFDPPEYAPVYADSSDEHVVTFASAHARDPFVEDSTGNAVPYHILSQHADLIRFDVDLSSAERVTLHHWYWPEWKLREGSREISEKPDAEGRATARIESGRHEYVYELETSNAERTGVVISLVSLAAIVAGVMLLRRRPHS